MALSIRLSQHFANVAAWNYMKRIYHDSLADNSVLQCAGAPRGTRADAFCDVCHLGPFYSIKGDPILDNPFLQCISCGIFVHAKCVGAHNITKETPFQCDRCQFLDRSGGC